MTNNGTAGTNEQKRFNMMMSSQLRGDLESWSAAHDISMSEAMKTGAEAMIKGYLLVLGSIPCGALGEALMRTRQYELAPPSMRPRADEGDFFLEAAGDSMAPKIESGDLVMLRPGIEFYDGEVCAVQVYADESKEGECVATLKHVIRSWDTGEVILRAANRAFPDQTVAAKRVQIVGVFRGLLKT